MQIRRSTWIFGAVAGGALVVASLVAPRMTRLGTGTGPSTSVVVGPLGPSGASAGHVRMDARLDASSVLLGGGGDAWLAITLNADADALAARARPPMNLAIVIDASGSMAGAPLASAKLAAKEMVARLTAADRVALVAYGSDGALLFPSTPLDPSARERVDRAIDLIGDMGGTNISAGLEIARAEVARGATKEHLNRVVLMSDGDANAGIQDPAGLGEIAHSMSAGGISTTAMGLGTSYNEDIMMAIAEHGGGNYYFVESDTQLAGIFEKELGAIASVVAKGTELEIVPADGVEVAEVVGWPSEKTGAGVVVRPGDLYGGQERKLVLRLHVPASVEGALAVAKVSLRFADALDAGALKIASADVGATVVADATLVEASRDKDVSAKVETVKVARKLEEATRAYEAGDPAKASALIVEGKDLVRAAAAGGLEMPASAAPMLDELDDYVHKGDGAGGDKLKKVGKASAATLAY